MVRAHLVLVLVAAAVMIGCTSTRPPAQQGKFAFQYDGITYEIVSFTTPEGDGHNLLIRRDGDGILLRARDGDQDGRLDAVLHGDYSLDKADLIYAAGIAGARASGRCSERMPQRVYEAVIDGVSYVIRTSILEPDDADNRLIVYDSRTGGELVFLDRGADGSLDIEGAQGAAGSYIQDRYELVLREGVRKGMIEHIDGRFVVRPRHTT